MKKLFPGFYNQNLDGVRDYREETIYIFDTNVLLNLYRYPDKPRELLLQILREISSKIWLPYQVAMEYHFNVMEEIVAQNKAYDGLIASLNEKYEKMLEDFQKFAQRHSNLQMDDELLEKVKESLDALVLDLEDQKSKHPDLNNLQEEVSEIIQNIGIPYTKEELEDIYQIGENRYKYKIPPGFKDQKKGDDTRNHLGVNYQNKYGDFILWRQILDHFGKEENKKKYVIFITDDNKSDWWKNIKGIKKPHPELIQEFTKECHDSSLLIFTTKQFLRHTSELIGLRQDADEIEEAIKSIDEYRKKKDISESADKKVLLSKQVLFEQYPFLEKLDMDDKLIFVGLINMAENESDIENAINWAKSAINLSHSNFNRDNNNFASSKRNRKRLHFDASDYPPKEKEMRYFEEKQAISDSYSLERTNVEDEYTLTHIKINELKNAIKNEVHFLDLDDQEEIITTYNAYEPIIDLDFKHKKLKELYSIVRNKRRY